MTWKAVSFQKPETHLVQSLIGKKKALIKALPKENIHLVPWNKMGVGLLHWFWLRYVTVTRAGTDGTRRGLASLRATAQKQKGKNVTRC
jgi:hypothetical protein